MHNVQEIMPVDLEDSGTAGEVTATAANINEPSSEAGEIKE